MAKKIGYLLFDFPISNMTYILNEITDLVDLSQDIEILSFDKPRYPSVHQSFYEYGLDKITEYLPFQRRVDGALLKDWDFILMAVRAFVQSGFLSTKERIRLLRDCYDPRLGRVLSLRRFSACVEVIKRVRDRGIEVLYIHLGNNALFFLPIKKIVSTPIIIFFHGMDFTTYPKSGTDYTELFSKGSLFFVGSKYARDAVQKLGCPESKIQILGIGVDSKKIRYEKRFLSDSVSLLTVGRFAEKKGLEYSIRAVGKVLETHRNVRYTIVGDGPLKPRLEHLIEELNLKDKVRLLGFLGQDQVIEVMHKHDIFILSSVTAKSGDTESLGVVLLEAQLTGMPVLATLHNGFPEAINVGRSGFLVPERDVESLVERLIYLIENPQRWEQMGIEGRDYVIANYDKREVRRNLVKKLNQVC